MDNFARAHDQYLNPPDDDPVCEDGCGETMVKDIEGEWYCPNKFCPLKFDGDAREMAEMLTGANETVKSLVKRIHNLKTEIR